MVGKKKSVPILTKYNQQEVVKVLKQSGKIVDAKRDYGRKAMLPGKRISKTGNVYWETRVNRTDKAQSRI